MAGKNMMAVFYVDGGSIGNEQKGIPRRARIAILYQESGSQPSGGDAPRVLVEEVGDKTNNEAEYLALLRLLSLISKNWTSPDGRILPKVGTVRILSDSELMVKQVNGDFRVKEERLIGLHGQARGMIDRGKAVLLQQIPREENYAGLWLEGKLKGRQVRADDLLPPLNG
jgi:ribonuclease HI